jgi:hypothetical protein
MNMDYQKLREILLAFLSQKPYVPTYEHGPLTDQIIDLVKAQEPQVAEPTEEVED